MRLQCRYTARRKAEGDTSAHSARTRISADSSGLSRTPIWHDLTRFVDWLMRFGILATLASRRKEGYATGMSGPQFVCPATDTGCPALAFVAGKLEGLEKDVGEVKVMVYELAQTMAVSEDSRRRRIAERSPWYVRFVRFVGRVIEERIVEITFALAAAAIGGAIGFSSCHPASIPVEASHVGVVK